VKEKKWALTLLVGRSYTLGLSNKSNMSFDDKKRKAIGLTNTFMGSNFRFLETASPATTFAVKRKKKKEKKNKSFMRDILAMKDITQLLKECNTMFAVDTASTFDTHLPARSVQ